ncbi:MAG TPA: hypothetical protein VGZ22_10390 [Isosphaeraceae bacterium]|jgi:hypothetical protein|nr:hypothetical protein [Isosphaeraceae bacterium]
MNAVARIATRSNLLERWSLFSLALPHEAPRSQTNLFAEAFKMPHR